MSGFARSGATVPVFLQAFEEPLVRCVRRRWLVNHNNVHAFYSVLVLAERLANDSLESVTTDRKPAVFLGDRKPEPRWPGWPFPA